MGKQFNVRDKDKMHDPGQAPNPMSAAITSLGSNAAAHEEHHGIAHIASPLQLAGVLVILLLLTFITVAVTWYDFGSLNLLIAMLIALIKASLVVLYFMHIKYDRPLNAIVLIGSLMAVMLFIDFALLDTGQYHPNQIPGYAPLIKQ